MGRPEISLLRFEAHFPLRQTLCALYHPPFEIFGPKIKKMAFMASQIKSCFFVFFKNLDRKNHSCSDIGTTPY